MVGNGVRTLTTVDEREDGWHVWMMKLELSEARGRTRPKEMLLAASGIRQARTGIASWLR